MQPVQSLFYFREDGAVAPAPAVSRKKASQQLFSLADIAARVVEAKRDEATQAGLTLHFSRERALPLLVGNTASLQEAIYCLVDNAIKFTKPGGRVFVDVYTEPGWVCAAVSDTGVGLDVKELENMANTPSPENGVTSQPAKKNGLGLALTRMVARVHGGQLDISSQPGKGSRFTIKIPEGTK